MDEILRSLNDELDMSPYVRWSKYHKSKSSIILAIKGSYFIIRIEGTTLYITKEHHVKLIATEFDICNPEFPINLFEKLERIYLSN